MNIIRKKKGSRVNKIFYFINIIALIMLVILITYGLREHKRLGLSNIYIEFTTTDLE